MEKDHQQSSNDLRDKPATKSDMGKEAKNKSKVTDPKEEIAMKSMMKGEPKMKEIKPITKMKREHKKSSSDLRDDTTMKKEATSKEAQKKPKVSDSKEKFVMTFPMNGEPKIGEIKPITRMDGEEVGVSKNIEDINESAEAFITKFKQQLMIQRAESIENYKNMLARGL